MSGTREIIRHRALGVCEVCGVRAGTDWSHRLPKGMGGAGSKGRAASDSPCNALWACRPCHAEIETCEAHVYDYGWKLRRGQDPEAVPALLSTPYGAGWYLLAPDGTYISD